MSNVYENVVKICGPYLGKDGRYRIYLKFNDNSTSFMSYPKYLMECHLGRYLEKNETIDHIDKNPLNNDISNLRVIDRKDHVINDIIRNKDAVVKCTYCGKEFTINGSKLHNRNRKDRHQSGYFCSRSCCGKYGKEIQLKMREHIKTTKIIPEKYSLHIFD